MLTTYRNSIVSIVSDTYSIWDVLTKHAVTLKDDILARPEGAKVVFRPDSGDPKKILLGDPEAVMREPRLGVFALLDEVFGHTVNEKGYKVLNKKIGVIYGDGMFFERWLDILTTMKEMGWSAENLIVGVGGILRNHSRDTFGFALKATYVEIGGEGHNIMKDPVTDHGKKSHEGLIGLFSDENYNLVTRDKLTMKEVNSAFNFLVPVYEDGKQLIFNSLDEMRWSVDQSLKGR